MVYHIPMNQNDQLIKRTCFQKIQHGVECVFIKINKNEGIKIYPEKRDAKFAMERQKQAYKYGIAPKVLSKVEKCFFDMYSYLDEETTHCYFYKTQVAEKVGNRTIKNRQEMNEIKSIFKKLKWCDGDFHSGNLGKINGKMVVIDFGRESTKKYI